MWVCLSPAIISRPRISGHNWRWSQIIRRDSNEGSSHYSRRVETDQAR